VKFQSLYFRHNPGAPGETTPKTRQELSGESKLVPRFALKGALPDALPGLPEGVGETSVTKIPWWIDLPGLVNVYKKRWKDPPFFMGKLTISMAIFNSEMLVYQRVMGKHGIVCENGLC